MFERSQETGRPKEQPKIRSSLDVVDIALSIYDVKNFFGSKGGDLITIAKEVRADIFANPTTAVESIVGGLASAIKTVVEYDEEKERKDLEMRQKAITRLQDLNAAEKRAEMLKNLSEAQKDALIQALLDNSRVVDAETDQRRAQSFKDGIHVAGEDKKKNAEADIDKTIADLLKMSRS